MTNPNTVAIRQFATVFWHSFYKTLAMDYFNDISFRLSQLHQCDEGMLPSRFLGNPLKSFSLISLFFQKTYLATFHAAKELL